MLPHQALLDRVWGDNDGATTHHLKVFISRLRAKLEPEGHPCLIETERDLGYQRVPPARWKEAEHRAAMPEQRVGIPGRRLSPAWLSSGAAAHWRRTVGQGEPRPVQAGLPPPRQDHLCGAVLPLAQVLLAPTACAPPEIAAG